MFQLLANKILLQGAREKNIRHYVDYSRRYGNGTNESVQCTIAGEEITQIYCLYSNEFKKEKDTLIMFPGFRGFACTVPFLEDNETLLDQYNIILIDYMGYQANVIIDKENNTYDRNVPKKYKNLKFDHIVEAAEQVTKEIQKSLKKSYEIQNDEELNNKIILYGTSMGSMVATKIAAHNEKDAKPLFKYVIAAAPAINVGSASACCLNNSSKIIVESCSTKEIIEGALLALLIYSAVVGIILAIAYTVLRYAIKLKLNTQQNLECSAAIAIALPIILLSLFVAVYLQQASKVGVSEQDITDLKDQQVYFVQIKGDAVCNFEKNKKLIAGKNNMQLIYLTDIKKDTDGNTVYSEPAKISSISKKPIEAHRHLIAHPELVVGVVKQYPIKTDITNPIIEPKFPVPQHFFFT